MDGVHNMEDFSHGRAYEVRGRSWMSNGHDSKHAGGRSDSASTHWVYLFLRYLMLTCGW